MFKIFFTRRITKIVSAVILYALNFSLFYGCSSGISFFSSPPKEKKFRYVYDMLDPISSKELKFSDSNISIQFTVDQGAVLFQLTNISKTNIAIEFSSATIGVNKQMFPVRNSVSYYSDNPKSLSPLIIPPQRTINDFVLPRQNIFWNEKQWRELELFQTTDSGKISQQKNIARNVGKFVDLVLPIRTGQNVNEYTFRFRVAAITPIGNKDSFAIPKQRPREPKTISENNIWLTSSIIGGIIIVSTAIILAKKETLPVN